VLCTGKEWFHQVLRQVKQRVDVPQWSDEYVTFEDRPVIKKCDHVVGTKDDRRVNIAAADLAENIVGHRHETSASRPTRDALIPITLWCLLHAGRCEPLRHSP
jgi:hypothetical protein